MVQRVALQSALFVFSVICRPFRPRFLGWPYPGLTAWAVICRSFGPRWKRIVPKGRNITAQAVRPGYGHPRNRGLKGRHMTNILGEEDAQAPLTIAFWRNCENSHFIYPTHISVLAQFSYIDYNSRWLVNDVYCQSALPLFKIFSFIGQHCIASSH